MQQLVDDGGLRLAGCVPAVCELLVRNPRGIPPPIHNVEQRLLLSSKFTVNGRLAFWSDKLFYNAVLLMYLLVYSSWLRGVQPVLGC